MLMMTQYTDMVKESIHQAGQVTISLNAAPTAAILLEDQIKDCIKNSESNPISAEELKQKLAESRAEAPAAEPEPNTVRLMVGRKTTRECRTFATTTEGLLALLEWLRASRVTH